VWPVLFTEAAGAELIDAQDWYEAQAPGLGRRFRAEIDSVVQRMADNPRQFPLLRRTKSASVSLISLPIASFTTDFDGSYLIVLFAVRTPLCSKTESHNIRTSFSGLPSFPSRALVRCTNNRSKTTTRLLKNSGSKEDAAEVSFSAL
jgi:plasmid stabilization system protein ParE